MSETATGAGPVSATVVIAQHVRPERKEEYLRWQAEINNLCRTFPGFEAMEVVPPVPGIQDDYVVVFRFDSSPHLDAWLRSDSRKALLARGENLFAGDARQQVVAGSRPATRGAGIVVSTHVKPGRENEYREWQGKIDAEAARFPGFLGNEVFAPVPGVQEEWVVVVRFDSPQHLQGWLLSDARHRLIDHATRLWDEARVESLSGGFPGWFAPGAAGPGQPVFPPDWKQAMIVLLTLYPTVMLLSLFLSPWLAGLPMPWALFISNVVSVVILTWLIMPYVNRLFGFWLIPSPSRSGLVESLGTGAVILGYAVALIIFLLAVR